MSADEELERQRFRNSLPMMPAIYQEIEGVIGLGGAIALMVNLGDGKVEFPAAMRGDAKLSTVLPPNDIAKLHAHFGKNKVKLPAGVGYLTMLRARHLRCGASIPVIARLLNRDTRTIANYCDGFDPGGSDLLVVRPRSIF